MTFSIDNPEGGCNNPPLGKYVWEKPSGEQGLRELSSKLKAFWGIFLYISEDAGRKFCFRSGFYSLLHRLYCARSLPTNVCRVGTSAIKSV